MLFCASFLPSSTDHLELSLLGVHNTIHLPNVRSLYDCSDIQLSIQVCLYGVHPFLSRIAGSHFDETRCHNSNRHVVFLKNHTSSPLLYYVLRCRTNHAIIDNSSSAKPAGRLNIDLNYYDIIDRIDTITMVNSESNRVFI